MTDVEAAGPSAGDVFVVNTEFNGLQKYTVQHVTPSGRVMLHGISAVFTLHDGLWIVPSKGYWPWLYAKPYNAEEHDEYFAKKDRKARIRAACQTLLSAPLSAFSRKRLAVAEELAKAVEKAAARKRRKNRTKGKTR